MIEAGIPQAWEPMVLCESAFCKCLIVSQSSHRLSHTESSWFESSTTNNSSMVSASSITWVSLFLLNSIAEEELESVVDKITFINVGQFVTLWDARTS